MLRPFPLLDAEVPATGAAPADAAPAKEPAAEAKPPEVKPSPGLTEAEIRARVLAEFGAGSADEVKAAIALAKAAEDAKKSDAEKLASVKAELDAAKKSASTLGDVLKTQVAGELAKLTEAQRAAVVAIAGDDPAKQILTLNNLRPTWAAATEAPQAPKANTAPAGKDPNPAEAKQQGDKRARFDSIRGKDPFLAAQFLAANPDALASA